MTDSVLVFPPGFRVLDSNGNPVNGAKIKFFEVGPGVAKNVFADASLSTNLGAIVYTRSDGFPVISSGSSTTTLIYVGPAAYYVVITDANDVALFPAKDNVKGAVDTSTFLTAGAVSILSIPMVSTAVDLTLIAAHRGKLISTTSTLALTLTAAATLGDGWNVFVRNDSPSATSRIASSNTINSPMGSIPGFALGPGAACEITCNGASFEVANLTPAYFVAAGVLEIADRVAVVPGSPAAGARYIATGVFAATPITTAIGDIIEATGQGTWFKITPPTNCGWLAFVKTEAAYYSFQGSAWAQSTASDIVAGLIELAVQSEMETATDVVRAVTPGRQKFHPAHAKAYGRFNSAGTLLGMSFGITSVTHTGTGVYTVVLSTAMSDTNYGVLLAAIAAGGVYAFVAITNSTTFVISTLNTSAVAADAGISFAVLGDI